MNEIEQAIEWLEEQLPPLEDYGNMIGAPVQYCGIKYVYNDPCGYVFETAIEALQEKLEREKGCEYCNCSTTEFEITVSDTVDFCKYCSHEKCLNDYGNDDCYGVGFNCIEAEYCPHCGRKLGKNNV